MFIVDAPAIRVKVRPKFLGKPPSADLEEGYLVAVTSLPSRPLFSTVHLDSGALWQRLPINALVCDKFNKDIKPYDIDTEEAQPFSCLEGDINIIEYSHLKNYEVFYKIGDSFSNQGYYLFTVDVAGKGLSEDPIQHKSHNIIVDKDSGNLFALPNNYCLFIDNYFTVNGKDLKYKRVDKYYKAGG